MPRVIPPQKDTGQTAGNKRPVEQYDHKAKKRANNPPVGLVDARATAGEGKQTYAYDPHLDPTLQWAGKAERTSFEIPTVSLHVHERIDPRAIIEAVRKKNGSNFEPLSLFGSNFQPFTNKRDVKDDDLTAEPKWSRASPTTSRPRTKRFTVILFAASEDLDRSLYRARSEEGRTAHSTRWKR